MKTNILLAEDDSDDQMFFETCLRQVSPEARLTIAASAEEAFSLLSSGIVLPDVCVFDINMPGMTGIELLRKLKKDEHYDKLPIVLLTTDNDPRTAKECMLLGAHAFYSKPGSFAELEAIIGKILR